MTDHNTSIGLQIIPKSKSHDTYELIDAAIAVIQASGVKHVITPFETVMEGRYDILMQVANEAQQAVLEAGAEECLVYFRIHYRKGEDVTFEEKKNGPVKVAVIGGGAAGFFTAINIAEAHPEWEIEILEKSNKLLSKVKVSGGGRCNVTNARTKPSELVSYYPRGQKKLYGVFERFGTSDMVAWLAKHGVPTNQEQDLRVFPASNSSQTIIDCFLDTARSRKVKVIKNCGVTHITPCGESWEIQTVQGSRAYDKVILATGGSPAVWKILSTLGLGITPPVPSLFTFNTQDPRIEGLMGISFPHVKIKVIGSKLVETGPLLITHWGLSGPAVLKLSAWGARELAKVAYQFMVTISYIGEVKSEHAAQALTNEKANHAKRKIHNYPLFDLPKRFWEQMCNHCEVSPETIYGEISKKQINKLTEELTQGLYSVKGKSTFKEEFVTAGGVKLSEIDLNTFEAKRYPNLFLAGEVLDIDALTGGFNFQACWSAAYTIAQAI